MNKRLHILDIPGEGEDKTTDRGRFIDELSDLVVFKPGTSFGFSMRLNIRFPSAKFVYGEGTWVETERGKQKLDGRWWVELVSKDSLHKLEKLLEDFNVDYVKNTKTYALCCNETTEESESLFLFNYHDEKLLFVSSPIQLFSSSAIAYLPEFNPDDERLERAFIDSMIDFRDNEYNWEVPPTSYNFFSSEEEAKKHIQEYLDDTVKGCLTGYEETYDAVILTDSNSDSDEELIFPEGMQITEQTRVTNSNMYLPKIVKIYPDGKVLVEGQQESLPLSQYFNKREGIKKYQDVVVCERCYGTLKDRLKEDARLEVMNTEFGDLTGPIANKIGYIFDPNRIKVRIIRKSPIKIYREKLHPNRNLKF